MTFTAEAQRKEVLFQPHEFSVRSISGRHEKPRTYQTGPRFAGSSDNASVQDVPAFCEPSRLLKILGGWRRHRSEAVKKTKQSHVKTPRRKGRKEPLICFLRAFSTLRLGVKRFCSSEDSFIASQGCMRSRRAITQGAGSALGQFSLDNRIQMLEPRVC